METVLLVVHLMVVASLVGVVLVQRSEGGALGIGGGGNFMASRGTGNVLTRVTTYLAAGFFATSITLTILAQVNGGSSSFLDNVGAEGIPDQIERTTTGNILDLIRPADQTPVVPNDGAAAIPATPGGAAIVPNDGVPVVPNDSATPVAPADATPLVPNDAGVLAPADATPVPAAP